MRAPDERVTRGWTRGSTTAAWLAALGLIAAARADSVLLVGEREAQDGVRIVTITAGSLSFADAQGRLRVEPIARVAQLGWDDLPALAAAQQAIADRDHDRAATMLRRELAGLREDSPKAQRIWVRAQLARSHAARGELVQAAGHAAVVCLLDDHGAWAALAPAGKMNEPPYAAVIEARWNLEQALAMVRTQQLRAQIDLHLVAIRAIEERAARGYTGPAIEPGSTLSGISIEQIIERTGEGSARTASTSKLSTPAIVADPAAESSPDQRLQAVKAQGGDAIDDLLNAGRFDEAVAACAAVAITPGDRSVSRLLLQYGRALDGAGRREDAAVMFMRCAILHADSPEAPAGLIATAAIYREMYDDAATARRLLERAIADLQHRGDSAMLAGARAALDSLGPATSNR